MLMSVVTIIKILCPLHLIHQQYAFNSNATHWSLQNTGFAPSQTRSCESQFLWWKEPFFWSKWQHVSEDVLVFDIHAFQTLLHPISVLVALQKLISRHCWNGLTSSGTKAAAWMWYCACSGRVVGYRNASCPSHMMITLQILHRIHDNRVTSADCFRYIPLELVAKPRVVTKPVTCM